MLVKRKYLKALRAMIKEYESNTEFYSGHPDEDSIVAVRKLNMKAGKELLEELKGDFNPPAKPE